MIIFSALIFAVIVSMDTLATGFTYGIINIKVPLRHAVAINIICSISVGLALFIGYIAGHYIPTAVTLYLGVGILVFIGLYKLIQYFINKRNGIVPATYQIKWPETITLAILLSIDGFAAGIGAAIHNASLAFCLLSLVFSFITDIVFFTIGFKIGSKITQKTRFDLSWLSGAVLIILGAIKLL